MALTDTSGIAGQSRLSFQGRLKTDFLPKWNDHIHTKTKVAEKIAKKKGTMGGLESLGSVMDALPQSAGVALLEGHDLPTPTVGSSSQPKLPPRAISPGWRGAGHVGGAARKGDKHAWAKPRAEDMR